MNRILQELRRSTSRGDVEAALASLRVHLEDGVAVITRATSPGGSALFGIGQPRTARVRIERAALAGTPTAEARVLVLATAAAMAPRVEVHAPIASDGTFRGRLLIDLPRRVARAIGVAVPESGDRFAGGFAHAFFDDEPIVHEAAAAGLSFVERRGPWVELDRTPPRVETDLHSFATELRAVLRSVRAAERERRRDSPERAVTHMRERGRRTRRRGPIGRARLRRAIGWVDAASLGGPNCFRRTLLELGLDAGAAEETIVFGLDVGRTGHVAFANAEDRAFDVHFEVVPE